MALVGGLAFFLNLFPGTILQLAHARWGLVLTQALFIAGPSLMARRWFYLDRRGVLPLRRPGAWALVGTAVGTVALNHLLTLAGAWQERIAPTPGPIRHLFENLFVYRGPGDYALLLVAFAVIPAVCEEILFRGFLQAGFLQLFESAPKGIVVTALVFAVFHLDPWRFLGVLLLGIFLGFVAHRTGSLIPAMVAHALNNLLSILQVREAFDPSLRPGSLWSVAAGLVVLGLSVRMLLRAGAEETAGRVL